MAEEGGQLPDPLSLFGYPLAVEGVSQTNLKSAPENPILQEMQQVVLLTI